MVSDRIKIVMELLNLDAAMVSATIGISQNMVYKYLNGKNEPSYKTLQKFCNAYHVHIEYMVKGMAPVFEQKKIDRMAEARTILIKLAVLRIERNVTLKQVQQSLDLPVGFFTDLKKGTISMPLDKKRQLRHIYGIEV